MARPLTDTSRRAMFAQQTGEVPLCLLTLSHASMSEPIRVVNDGRDLISRGTTYQSFPFEIDWPSEADGAPGPVKLRIANADRRIVQAIRELSGEALIAKLELVLASEPDDVFAGPVTFKMRSAPYNAEWVEADLTFDDPLDEPCPADEFSPSNAPALF